MDKPTALEVIRFSSTPTLEAYELARRNEASQLTKQIKSLIWLVVEALTDAEMARVEIERRREGGKMLDGPAPASEDMLTTTERGNWRKK